MRKHFIWRCLGPIGLALLLMGAGGDRPPLLDAAKNADRGALSALLQKQANANAAEADGSTALHWACYHDDLASVELLIRAGAAVNQANDLGATPLWLAAQNGGAAVVGSLLRAGANPNAALLSGETPLMAAARAGFPEVVEQLADAGADVNADATRGQTALMWAAAQKHPAVVKTLLAHGADVQARSATWSQMMAVPPHGYPDYNKDIPHGGATALLFAVRAGDLASANLLVAAGADVNDEDAWGVSATVLSAHSGFREIVAFLLENRADPNRAAAGFSALHIAVMRRDEQMAGALLARGADPNTPLQTWTPTRRSAKDLNFPPELVGATPFWLAARFCEPGLMRLLAQHGADPLFVHRADFVAGSGWQRHSEATTALMAAAGMGRGTSWVPPATSGRQAAMLEAVKLAAELGVDSNAANADGRTALAAAKALGYETVVRFLVEIGAK